MSVTVMSRVFWTEIPTLAYPEKSGKTTKVSGSVCKFVLLAIADNANDQGEQSWQSIDTIASKTSIARRSVIRAIAALKWNGYVAIDSISKYGTNNFIVILDRLGEIHTQPSRTGRPRKTFSKKTSDSETKSSDSETKSSDSESPESSLTILNHKRNFSKKIAGETPSPSFPQPDGI